MLKLNGITGLLLVTVLAGSGAALAEGADDSNSRDAQAIMAVKVSPAQAIQNAEAKAGGKVVSLDFVSSNGAAPFYHLEVIASHGSKQNLAVDTESGEIMKTVAMDDHENGEQSDEGEDGNQQ